MDEGVGQPAGQLCVCSRPLGVSVGSNLLDKLGAGHVLARRHSSDSRSRRTLAEHTGVIGKPRGA